MINFTGGAVNALKYNFNFEKVEDFTKLINAADDVDDTSCVWVPDPDRNLMDWYALKQKRYDGSETTYWLRIITDEDKATILSVRKHKVPLIELSNHAVKRLDQRFDGMTPEDFDEFLEKANSADHINIFWADDEVPFKHRQQGWRLIKAVDIEKLESEGCLEYKEYWLLVRYNQRLGMNKLVTILDEKPKLNMRNHPSDVSCMVSSQPISQST